jgi:hypothetical protein
MRTNRSSMSDSAIMLSLITCARIDPLGSEESQSLRSRPPFCHILHRSEPEIAALHSISLVQNIGQAKASSG